VFKGQFDDNPYYDTSRNVMMHPQQSIRWYLRPKKPWIDPWLSPSMEPVLKPNPKAKELIEKLLNKNNK
jgi:hypothetical protein